MLRALRSRQGGRPEGRRRAKPRSSQASPAGAGRCGLGCRPGGAQLLLHGGALGAAGPSPSPCCPPPPPACHTASVSEGAVPGLQLSPQRAGGRGRPGPHGTGGALADAARAGALPLGRGGAEGGRGGTHQARALLPGRVRAAVPTSACCPPQEAWGAGCVTLVGDAAHAMLPMLGQGASQAIESAVALAVVRPGRRAWAGAARG